MIMLTLALLAWQPEPVIDARAAARRAQFVVRMGWRKDRPDHRDADYVPRLAAQVAMPPVVDLSAAFPPPYDQGRIGSCTGNALAGALQYDRRSNRLAPDFIPSRLFIYYWERSAERSVPYDSGAEIRDGITALAKYGCCPEADWPYDDTPPPSDDAPWPPTARARQAPSKAAATSATRYKISNYARVTQSAAQLKAALAAGDAVVFGFTVYDSFFDAQGNPRAVVPMPSKSEGVQGGHAVVLVGYDDAKAQFKCRNSWGVAVQDHGYFRLPYAYVTNAGMASDFWVIRAELNLKLRAGGDAKLK